MVSKFTNQPTNKEVVTKINDIIDDMPTGTIPTKISDLTDDTSTTPVAKASSATTATKLGVSDVGSATKGIYLDDGVPTACSHSVNTDVPSNAVFTDTDTKYTAGSSNSTSKLFIIGATAQGTAASNAQAKTTYSNSAVYEQNGYLYATTPASTTNDTTVATTKFVKDQGYTGNTGTVTSVNNVSPINGNVSLTIPIVPTSLSSFTDDLGSSPTHTHSQYLTSVPAGYLQNAATGTNSLTILGTASASTGATNVGLETVANANYGSAFGYKAKASASSSTAVGRVATASGSYSVALGYGATCSGGKSIQLGYGTNSTATSLFVGFQGVDNYQLIDGTTGLIPDVRLSTNIARSADIPTSATATEVAEKTSTTKMITPSNLDQAVKLGVTNNSLTLSSIEQANALTWLGVPTDIANSANKDLSNLSETGEQHFDQKYAVRVETDNLYGWYNSSATPTWVYTINTSPSSGNYVYDWQGNVIGQITNATSTITVKITSSSNSYTYTRNTTNDRYLRGRLAYRNTTTLYDINIKQADGQWVHSYKELSTATSISSYNIDLSNYLPNDAYQYEVLLGHWGYKTGSDSSKIYVSSDIITSELILSSVNSNARQNVCYLTIPVGTGRKLVYKIAEYVASGSQLKAYAYRRIGTNH